MLGFYESISIPVSMPWFKPAPKSMPQGAT